MTGILGGTPPFVTFYSFKGGVGRTMALLNVACILAGRGRRVLAIDMDLEAPGLTYLAGREQEGIFETPGFVDLVYDLLTKGRDAPIADPERPDAFLQYTCRVPIPDHATQGRSGELHIMPAGRIDQGYEDKLLKIDLGRLYGEGKGKPILEHIRNVIARSGRFDYVLIDSRTGFSDEAGICVRDLGDRLVILLGLNRQNVSGTARFLQRLRQRQALPVAVAFVASPVPIGEDQLRTERLEIAQKELSKAWGEPVRLDIRIPYHPRLALDEDPIVFRWSDTVLYPAYEKLEEVVRGFADDVSEVWLKRVQDSIDDGRHDMALQGLAEIKKLDRHLGTVVLRGITEGNIGNARFDPYFAQLFEESGQQPEIKQVYGEHLAQIGRVREGVAILREALPHFERTGRRDKMLACHRAIGEALANTPGQEVEALNHLEAALALSRKTGSSRETVAVLRTMGLLRLRSGDENGGLENLQEASEILMESEDAPVEAAHLKCAMSEYYEKKGDYRKAISILEDAARDFTEMGKPGRSNLVRVRHSLGRIHRVTGDYELALRLFLDNSNLQQELGDRRGAAATQHSIAEVHKLRGDYQTALALYEESLKVSQELGDRLGAADAQHSIADIHRLRGDYQTALTLYEESLKVSQELGDRRGAAVTQHAIADIHKMRGDYRTALALFEESLRILQELGDRRGAAFIQHTIADIHKMRGDYRTALALFEESLKVSQELGDRRRAADTQHAIAGIHKMRGDYRIALALYEESLKVSQKLGDRPGAVITQHAIADIHKMRGDYRTALALFEESLKASQQLGDVHGTAITQGYLGFTMALAGRHVEGELLIRNAISSLTNLDCPEPLARLHMFLAQVLLLQDRFDASRQALEDAERLTAALGAKHYGADIAVIRAQHLPELTQVELENVRESLAFYRSQDIQTPEAKIAEELLQTTARERNKKADDPADSIE
jgi:tetratricopeptide (TPR) repeat protein